MPISILCNQYKSIGTYPITPALPNMAMMIGKADYNEGAAYTITKNPAFG